MKKLFFLFTLCSFLFIACKKNDDVKKENSSIVGQWVIASEHVEEYSGNTKIKDYTNSNVGKVVFNTNGSFTASGPNGEDPESGSYIFDAGAKTLSLKYEHETEYATAPILEMTNSRIVIQIVVIYNPPIMGVDKEVTTLTLTK